MIYPPFASSKPSQRFSGFIPNAQEHKNFLNEEGKVNKEAYNVLHNNGNLNDLIKLIKSININNIQEFHL